MIATGRQSAVAIHRRLTVFVRVKRLFVHGRTMSEHDAMRDNATERRRQWVGLWEVKWAGSRDGAHSVSVLGRRWRWRNAGAERAGTQARWKCEEMRWKAMKMGGNGWKWGANDVWGHFTAGNAAFAWRSAALVSRGHGGPTSPLYC